MRSIELSPAPDFFQGLLFADNTPLLSDMPRHGVGVWGVSTEAVGKGGKTLISIYKEQNHIHHAH